MPWMAVYDGDIKAPRQVPKTDPAECPECGGTVHVRGPFDDGRARHFWHTDNVGNENGGGGNSCETVAESEVHQKWKSLTADRLEQVFAESAAECEMEREVEAPVSDKDRRIGDAVLLFETRDAQLGKGVVAEVQHKNDGKDIDSTTKDYLAQDFAVVWLEEADFTSDRCSLLEVDFRHRAQNAVWPDCLDHYYSPHSKPFNRSQMYRRALASQLDEPDIPAALPPEWYDETAQRLWREQDWRTLFTPAEDYTDIWPYAKVPATTYNDWYWPTPAEYWESTAWTARFNPSKKSRVRTAGWSLETDIPGKQYLRTSQRALSHVQSRASATEGQSITICPNCRTKQSILPIHPGEIRRAMMCTECKEWFTAYDDIE